MFYKRIRKKLNIYWVSIFSVFIVAVVIACGSGGSGDRQVTNILIPDVECPTELNVETSAGEFIFELEDGCFDDGFILNSPELLEQFENCVQLIDETFVFVIDTLPGQSTTESILTMFLPEVLPDDARLLACDFDTLELCVDITELTEFVAVGPNMFEILITDGDGLDTDFAFNGSAQIILALADSGCNLNDNAGSSTGTGGGSTATGSDDGSTTSTTGSGSIDGTTSSGDDSGTSADGSGTADGSATGASGGDTSTTGDGSSGSGGSFLGVDADASVGDSTVTGDATVGSDTGTTGDGTGGDSGTLLGVDADASVGDSTVTGDATVGSDTGTTGDGTGGDSGTLLGVDASVGDATVTGDATVGGDGGILRGSGTSF